MRLKNESALTPRTELPDCVMHDFLHKHPLILMEAAITEPLRRMEHVTLHSTLTVSPLIYDDRGRCELEKPYLGCLQVAHAAELPFVMFTPTWRANAERVKGADATGHDQCRCHAVHAGAS